MGMSASQMRYLMISGKKSDIEFQGQQINQQRTTLATESSSLNSSLLSLSVPTPPSSKDYTKVNYSYDGNDGKVYTVKSLQYMSDEYTDDNGKTYAGNTYIMTRSYETVEARAEFTSRPQITKQANGTYQISLGNNVSQALTKVELTGTGDDVADDINAVSLLNQLDRFKGANEEYYKYQPNNGSATKYFAKSDLEALQVGVSSNIPAYEYNAEAKFTKSEKIYGCENPQYAASGRFASITIPDSSNGSKYEIEFSVSTTTDDAAYNDAYNEYVYQKQEYEDTMNKINAQLEVIQAQDKKLELKLTDLDTQQQAISTEMDAVKKVIDKNVETSFKTFA